MARACATVLLSPADCRADLRSALQHNDLLADLMTTCAIKLLAVDSLSPLPRGQLLAFHSDRRLLEALLAKLAADASPQRVRCHSGCCRLHVLGCCATCG